MKNIEPIKNKEGEVNIVYVEAVHMPNGELICEGKTLFFVKDENKKFVYKEKELEKKSIRIPFSEEDLQDLMAGETFDWTFDDVDVHLYQGNEEDEDNS